MYLYSMYATIYCPNQELMEAETVTPYTVYSRYHKSPAWDL